jgi:hypothetical protein
MTSGNKCKVKDDLVNQLVALNNKVNALSPDLLHSEQARAEVQERQESLYVEIKRHRRKDTKASLVLPSSASEAVIASEKRRRLGGSRLRVWG